MLADLVLVHGGAHAADCWDPTVAELRSQEPQLRVLAVDLPGRRSKPGDLSTATISDWADSVVADIDAAGFGDVVIVGHSLAGVTVPAVVSRLGARRVREMILAAAFVPPQGSAVVDTLGGPLAWLARRAVRSPRRTALPTWLAGYAFCNGMSSAQREFTLSRLCDESVKIIGEKVDRADMPSDVPRTWIRTTKDRALSQRSQTASIAALGGVQTVIPVDACHNLMISEPRWLATTLIEHCRVTQ